MKSFSKIFVLLILLGLGTKIKAVNLINLPKDGVQYETLTFRFDENLPFENPFDLITNQVELHILQPDYTRLVLSFFYNGLNKDSVEKWEARFAPKQAGVYRFSMVINGKTQEQFQVVVKADNEKVQSAIVLSKKLGVFKYDSGEAFRGIGMNVCWANNFEYYFKKMNAAGMNVTRIWLCPWSLSFEWKETGLGRYSLNSASQLDYILNLAKKYGIYIILCIDYHGVAPKGMGFFKEDRWLDNPYNKINGGPCANEAELFTNPVAKFYFMKKYKYIISRFGHSANILAWEFFNEADLMAGKSLQINRWHIEMAEYIKSIDVHKHLVSSSSTRGYLEKLVDAFKSPAIDFAMFHDYNSLNIAPHFIDLYDATTEYYQKPVVLGEFGVEFRGGELTYKEDPHHIGLHNGIWAGWFSETPVIPLSWWWDSYIDRYNIWGEYAGLSRFAGAMNFNVKNLIFKNLIPGNLKANPIEQASCMIRSIYYGGNCALWLKNIEYQWSVIGDTSGPKEIGGLMQDVPDLAPGHYKITWFNPQTGQFFDKSSEGTVKDDGVLLLSVPPFVKDLACLIKRQ